MPKNKVRGALCRRQIFLFLEYLPAVCQGTDHQGVPAGNDFRVEQWLFAPRSRFAKFLPRRQNVRIVFHHWTFGKIENVLVRMSCPGSGERSRTVMRIGEVRAAIDAVNVIEELGIL